MPSDLKPPPLLSFREAVPWMNKHANVSGVVNRRYDVWNRTSTRAEPAKNRWRAGLNALRQIVRDAESASARVRAFGSAWSLSEAPYCSEYLVNTKPLNYVDVGVAPKYVDPASTDAPERLVFAQCGLHVMELNAILEARGLSLPASGASNGQTICGAVSTGTHGSAIDFGGMPEFVAGIHLLAEGGEHYWIEPEDRPAMSKGFADSLGAHMVRDTRLFRAVLVSFGSFGLIHAMALRSSPLFFLEKHRFRRDFSMVKPVLSTLDFSKIELPRGARRPYHFEVVLNPYGTEDGERGAFVTVMYEVPEKPESPRPRPGGVMAGDDLLNFIGALSGHAPGVAVAPLVTALLNSQYGESLPIVGTLGELFGPTDTRGPVLSCELGIPLGKVALALDEILAAARQMAFVGAIALRFIPKSRALLALNQYEMTCTIELPGAASGRTAAFFEAVFAALEAKAIPFALHWGQCGSLGPDRIQRMYGDSADEWVAARGRFLSPRGRRTFSNPWLDAAGLSA